MARRRTPFPPLVGSICRAPALRTWQGWPPKPSRPTLIVDKLTGETRWEMPATGEWEWDPEAREWFELETGEDE